MRMTRMTNRRVWLAKPDSGAPGGGLCLLRIAQEQFAPSTCDCWPLLVPEIKVEHGKLPGKTTVLDYFGAER